MFHKELLTEILMTRIFLKVVNLWPEAPLHSSAYSVPEIRGGYGAWVRDQIQLRWIKSYLIIHIQRTAMTPFCRQEFKQDANDKLSRIRSGDISGKELLFVGLHVRRGDYVEFGRQVIHE